MKVKPGLYLTKSGDLALVESRRGDGSWLGRLNFANVAWDASGEAIMVSYDDRDHDVVSSRGLDLSIELSD